MENYPSFDLLFTQGGNHGVGQVVLPAATTVEIRGVNKNRMTMVVRPETITDCLLCGSKDDTTGFPLTADSAFAIPSKDAIFLRSTTGGTVHFVEFTA